ncbi:MAG: hypothetical protein ACLT1W_12530 [Alistipes onderdonkii]
MMRTVGMFGRSGVEFNTLSVVNRCCEGAAGDLPLLPRRGAQPFMQFCPLSNTSSANRTPPSADRPART